MKNRIIVFLVIISLLIIPTMSVAALGDAEPMDLGLASPFEALLTRTNSLDPVVDSSFSGGGGVVRSCIPPSAQCTFTKTPGEIKMIAFTKDAPTNAVVVSQDPFRSGVDLTWTLKIFPDVYTYGLWENIPYPEVGNCKKKNAECIINESGKPCCAGLMCVPFNKSSGNGKCREDPRFPPIYGCVDHYETWQNTIATLTPKAILTTASRNWILNDLARAYPGTYLKHPDWGFNVTKNCVWEDSENGKICVWTHTEGHVLVADPGWYDLIVTGTTMGTYITPPREFILTGEEPFGVYLVENSITGLS